MRPGWGGEVTGGKKKRTHQFQLKVRGRRVSDTRTQKGEKRKIHKRQSRETREEGGGGKSLGLRAGKPRGKWVGRTFGFKVHGPLVGVREPQNNGACRTRGGAKKNVLTRNKGGGITMVVFF